MRRECRSPRVHARKEPVRTYEPPTYTILLAAGRARVAPTDPSRLLHHWVPYGLPAGFQLPAVWAGKRTPEHLPELRQERPQHCGAQTDLAERQRTTRCLGGLLSGTQSHFQGSLTMSRLPYSTHESHLHKPPGRAQPDMQSITQRRHRRHTRSHYQFPKICSLE